jgi:hypothetical protein
MMHKLLIPGACAIAISLAGCGGPQPATSGGEATMAESQPVVTLTLPAGDIAAGRQAFQDLKCTACHAVPSEPNFPPPVATTPGPVIDTRVAGRDASYLVTAVMSPSHSISSATSEELQSQLEGVLSPMGDFSHVMTVRQLVDLYAYLHSIG